MENLISIFREWHPIGQFIIALILAFGFAIGVVIVIGTIDKFINHTLPIICRGWPPQQEDDDDEDSAD